MPEYMCSDCAVSICDRQGFDDIADLCYEPRKPTTAAGICYMKLKPFYDIRIKDLIDIKGMMKLPMKDALPKINSHCDYLGIDKENRKNLCRLAERLNI